MVSTPAQDATMPRRAYSYRRISSFRQRKGRGLDRQDDGYAEQLCEKRGWYLDRDETLTLVDSGKSAYKQSNLEPTAALGQFLELIARDRISRGSILIIESLDRLSRAAVGDASELFRRILKAGITICTREPEREYTPADANNMLIILEMLFIASRSHEESATKAFRGCQSWATEREELRSGKIRTTRARTPGWLKKTKTGYVAIKERVETVHRMFELCIEGHGMKAIARELTREGREPFGYTTHWNHETVHWIIRHRHVLGESQDAEGNVPGVYPAIISEELWERARAALANRRRTRGRPSSASHNLFTGLVENEQGKSMHLVNVNWGGKKYPSLVTKGGVPGATRCNYHAFEECVLGQLEILRPEDVCDKPEEVTDRERQIASLTNRLTALDTREKHLQEAAADPDQDATLILPILAQVGKERKAVAAQLEALRLLSRSGRVESLADSQSLTALRDQTEGEKREELDRRLKATLPTVISKIIVRMERTSARKQFTYVRIVLKSGRAIDATILPRGT